MVALPEVLHAMLPNQLTLGDLREPLAEVGIDSRHIKSMQIDHDRASNGMVLVVTTLDMDPEGRPYVSDLTGEHAIEIARFPLTFLEFEAE